MKNRLLSIFFTIISFMCNAEIIPVTTMQEAGKYFEKADSETLVIFDVDMVLVQPENPAFQMKNMKNFGSVSKKIMKSIPEDKKMIFLSLMTLSSDPVLIDAKIPQYIKQMALQGASLMALTANLTGELGHIKHMDLQRVEALKKIGIDFVPVAPFSEPFIFSDLASYRGNYSTYVDGILFVNGTTVTKGQALLSFLKHINTKPKKVIFIDDKEDNLINVEEALATLSIEYVGLHYSGAAQYPSLPISESEFEARWLELAEQAKQIQ